ncbi:MAG TPA: insulinase family protein [Vicinamibacterales bacterium]|nr:insulinase family protein [Vicinamibacterales bacterium]
MPTIPRPVAVLTLLLAGWSLCGVRGPDARFEARLLAQAAPASTVPAPTGRIPLDPAVLTGELPSGLRYYIRQNGRPEKRAFMQLAVKAGSIDENDRQQGLAHFLEHMAFNGTRRFKPGELIAALEQTGARLGPHVNAYTSFDETVYMFQLPTDKEGIVEKGLQALADFAGGMVLDPAEIDKERGVVIEEWRGGLGVGSRIRDQQVPVLYHQSKYAERLPIGKPEVLKTFTPEDLRSFYTRWYRPDRMAVVVVGDFDPKQMESLVRAEFGALPKAEGPPPERHYPVPLPEELLVEVSSDPEATQSSVSIIRKRTSEPEGTVADYRRALVHQLIYQMLNERFDEISRKPDAPFLGAGAYGNDLAPTVTTFSLGASVQEGKIEAGLSALQIESRRVQEHGFGAAELDRARKWVLASYERAYTERNKTESPSYAREYVDHFLEGEPSPGIEYEHQLVKSVVPAITAAEVADAARKLFSDASRVILAVSPQKPDLSVPTEAQLRTAVTAAGSVAVTAWNDAGSDRELMEHMPDPGKVTARREIPELGTTVVTLSNGVEAWLKPTDFKNDQVLFALTASGGSSLADPAKYPEAQLSTALVELSGAGGHSAVDLQKLLAGRILNVSSSVGLSSHGVSGSSTPANLEPALQLLNLYVTAPGNDPQAFEMIKRQLEASYLNRERSPNAVFGEKVSQVNTMDHYTAKPLTVERIRALDRDAMIALYRERYSNAADFTFFMVGAFKVEEALPLLARYVGSLPSMGKATSRFREVGLRFPPSNERVKVERGREPRSQTVISFFAAPPIEENEQSRVEAATEVLEIALRDILREELGETYSVSVGSVQPLPQPGYGRIVVSFGAAPENVDRMVERVMEEVRRLQKEGPSEDLTTRAKESARREHETALKQNGFWLGRLQSAKLLDRDPLLILKRMERIDAITPALLHDVFRKYFPMDRNTVVTLVPEQS